MAGEQIEPADSVTNRVLYIFNTYPGRRGLTQRGMEKTSRLMRSVVAICVAILWLARPALAQDEPEPVTAIPTSVTTEAVQTRLQAVQADTDLDEALRTELVAIYQRVINELEAGKSTQAQIDKLNQDTAAIDDNLARVQAATEAIEEQVTINTQQQRTVNELDGKVRETQEALDKTKAELVELQAQKTLRATRRLEIPQRIAELQLRLEQSSADSAGSDGTAPQLLEAQRLLNAVLRSTTTLQIEALRKELAYYEQSETLLDARIARAQKQVRRLESELDQWQEAVSQARQEVVENQAAETTQQATSASPELSELARENVTLVNQRQSIRDQIELVRTKRDETTRRLEELSDEFRRLRQYIDAETGVTEAAGELLRQRARNLPRLDVLRQQSAQRSETAYDARIAEFQAIEQSQAFSNFDERVAQELEQLRSSHSRERVAELEAEIRQLLRSRQDVLQGLLADYNTYINGLTTLGVQQEQLIQLTERYHAYIDERILWIRSLPVVSWSDVLAIRTSVEWLTSPDSWRALVSQTPKVLKNSSASSIATLVALAILILSRRHAKRRLRALGKLASSPACREFSVTFMAIADTLLLAALWPTVLTWLHLHLSQYPSGVELAGPLSRGLSRAAFLLVPIELWRRTITTQGLGAAHFDWPNRTLTSVESAIRFLIATYVPAAALGITFAASNLLPVQYSGARFCMVLASAAMAFFLYKVMSPRSGAMAEFLTKNRDSWLDRLRYVWLIGFVTIPLAFCLLSLAGYQYTAVQLMRRFFWSLALLSFLWILGAICLRWLTLKHRTLAIEQARERLTAAAAESEGAPSDRTTKPATDDVDLAAISAQTLRLLWSFGTAVAVFALYFIWVGVLPALERLDEYHLWQTERVAQQVVTTGGNGDSGAPGTEGGADATGTAATASGPRWEWITLGDLIGSLILLVLTIIAVRNVPGLVEIVLLQRLPLEPALRFAITTLIRYALIVAGIGWAFTLVGFGWSKLQWLAAGVGVGLGFGLQEVFANFVSGLIVLFERPLRKGDIVTVGDVTGVVVDIKTRATTIRDWDRKELIVPNKELITNRLLNWTLTDTMNRLSFQVSVAYGTDIDLTRNTLLQVIREQEHVLNDPEPVVLLDRFTEIGLNFAVYVYLSKLDNRLATTHNLYRAIHDRFSELGIQFAFPRRDLHVQSAPPELTPQPQGDCRQPREPAVPHPDKV